MSPILERVQALLDAKGQAYQLIDLYADGFNPVFTKEELALFAEGKAVLFKDFGGVDAWPVVLDTKDTEEIISIVKAIAPAYGGINLVKRLCSTGFVNRANRLPASSPAPSPSRPWCPRPSR